MPIMIKAQEEVEEILSKESIIELEVPKGVEKFDFKGCEHASWIMAKSKETGNSYYKLISPNFGNSFGNGFGTWLEIHVALAGLVCEIYLKHLIYKNLDENNFHQIRGHDLQDLFNQLNLDQKNEIISYFPEFDLKSFKKEIGKIKSVFEDFRYGYEINGCTIHCGLIKKFTDVLHEIVNKK